MNNGKYIVLEGPEGVGKTTQVQELARKLQAAGLPVRTLREPDSQSDLTARAIRNLTQDPSFPMNTNTEVLLYNAARSQSLQVIKQSVEQGVICLVDRNYLTTLAVQYYGRGDVPDYNTITQIINFAVNGIEPDLTIILDAPVSLLMQRLAQRNEGDRFDNLDAAFLERVRSGYLWEANQRGLPIIFANKPMEYVADEIWKQVSKTLSIRKALTRSNNLQKIDEMINTEPPIIEIANKENSSPTKSEDKLEPINYLIKSGKETTITKQGKEYLKQAVTDVDGNVYAFTNYLSPPTIAAAMARLSRRGDDMRLILLDEFANNQEKDKGLLQRVITAYGDDSVQQLAGIHLVVEQASNLLTKKLEWGRLASYLEQSTRYIYFDKKDKNDQYKYFTPDNLDSQTKKHYQKTIDQIFNIYSQLVHQLTDYIANKSDLKNEQKDGAFKSAIRAQACDAVRALLPVATTSTVGIFASGQAIESLIIHLLSDPSLEAQQTGQAILKQARQIIPMFLERADKPDRGGATTAYRATTNKSMQSLTNSLLDVNLPPQSSESITLVDFWPRNELDLVADMLYEYTNLPLKTIKEIVNSWSYEEKVQVIQTYTGERLNRRHRPGRALEKIHYSWDLITDYGIFRDLQRHRIVDDLQWQKLTPRYGYEIPKLVEDAGLSDRFEKCFDLSLELYSYLQSKGYYEEAQYATLLGHRMRWKITYNAREAFHLHELRTSPQGHPGYRKLIKEMHDKVAEVHPLIAQQMKFINKNEDPQLNRLAAERYSQFKLSLLTKKTKTN